MSGYALIVAAGRGSRARALGAQRGADVVPKQYVEVGGRPVLARTLAPFLAHPGIEGVLVVIHEDDRAAYDDAVGSWGQDGHGGRLMDPVIGGHDRQASVLAGLEALHVMRPDTILIHDAARPFADGVLIDRVLGKLPQADGAICAVPVADTLKRVSEGDSIVETVARDGLWRAQTPQGFGYEAILDAHRKAATYEGLSFTDDASIAEWAGLTVCVVAGGASNDKLTTHEDLILADDRIAMTARDEFRTGTGYDVHRFGPGSYVWLCGVQLEHTHSLIGHSDADVGLHALTDALFGALGEGDIGSHFPPSDPKWKGARSDTFLECAARKVRVRDGTIVNVDVTLVCEMPKVAPHREKMRVEIARILDIELSRVSVKATTSEGLGFTGRAEGIAAMASSCIRFPSS